MHVKLLPPPTMLSCRIPFGGFYGNYWDDAHDREHESLIEHWQDCIRYDRDRLDGDLGTHGIPDQIVQEILERHIGEILSDVSCYRQYMNEVAQLYADSFAWWITDSLDAWTIGPLEEASPGYMFREREAVPFEYEEMTSPAYYNFETDRIFGKFSEATLLRIYDELGEADRTKAFRDMFTSRAGFISFYDNEPPHKPIADWDHNELYALLTAWVDKQVGEAGYHGSIDSELYEGLYEDCSRAANNAIDWDKLQKAVADKVAEHREELEEAGIDPDTLPLPRCTQTLELPL